MTAPAAVGLYSSISGLVMDAGGTRRSGVTVVLHPDGTAHGRRWLREPDGTIRPSYDTGLCLSVRGARYRPGTTLDVEKCENFKNQRFAYAKPTGSTPVFFISPAADHGLCATSATGFFNSGDAVILAACGSKLTAPGAEVWATVKPPGNVGTLSSNIELAAAGTTAGSPVIATNDFGLPLRTLWLVSIEQVAPFGTERVLRPLSNTALCVTRAGAEAAGTALRLEKCGPTAAQAFMGIETVYNAIAAAYFITEPDGRLCVTINGGATAGHPAVLGRCVGTPADSWQAATWTAALDLTAGASDSYQELYDNDVPTAAYSIGLTGTGAGAKAIVALDQEQATQVWTDLPPSGAGLPSHVGNPDGSITLRPLSDTALCLTVPGARYAAGQQLAVQPCDGQVDQEFLRLPNGNGNTAIQELVAYGDGRLCAAAASPTPGTPVRLAPCGSGPALSWIPMRAWEQWGGGKAIRIFGYAAAGPRPVLAMGPAAGAVAPAVTEPFVPGDTTQAWLSGQPGFRPVANTGWCRLVPSLAVGTVLTVQPCGTGNNNQGFTAVYPPGAPFGYFELEADTDHTLCQAAGTGSSPAPVTLQACSPTDITQWWRDY